jgi:hypothetical protein
LLERYDGRNLWFRVTEQEAKNSYSAEKSGTRESRVGGEGSMGARMSPPPPPGNLDKRTHSRNMYSDKETTGDNTKRVERGFSPFIPSFF